MKLTKLKKQLVFLVGSVCMTVFTLTFIHANEDEVIKIETTKQATTTLVKVIAKQDVEVSAIYLDGVQVSSEFTLLENKDYEINVIYNDNQKYTKIISTTNEVALSLSEKTGTMLVPDENLYRYLIEVKNLPVDFTKEDLLNVDFIDYRETATSRRIEDITGVEYMLNLQYIYMNDQSIKTLEPLKQSIYPKVRNLEFNNYKDGTNEIHDFSWLTHTRFPNLDGQIMFNNNNINDVDLETLPKIDRIPNAIFHFQKNNITDLSIFTYYLDARTLVLNYNNIRDISVLSNLSNIRILQLSNNQIHDISPLATIQTQPNAMIWLNNNQIIDMSALQSINAKISITKDSLAMDYYVSGVSDKGQQYTVNTPVVGDSKTGIVNIQSVVRGLNNEVIGMNVAGQRVTSTQVKLDPKKDNQFTYTVEYTDGKTTYYGVITQPITWWNEPKIIEIEPIEINEGDTVDGLYGLRAIDSEGNDLSSQLTIIESNLNLAKPGTYFVKCQVHDMYGNIATFTRAVKVHGEIQLKVPNQIYTVTNTNLDYSIRNRLSASYLQAQDEIGSTPKLVTLSSENFDYQLETPSSLQETGIHTIEYYSKVNPKVKTQAKVLITAPNSVQDSMSNLIIQTADVELTKQKVLQLSESEILSILQARAFEIVRDESGAIVDFNEITTLHVNEKSLQGLLNTKDFLSNSILIRANSKTYEVSKKVTVMFK